MAHYDCMICKYIDAFHELSCGIQRFSAAEGLQSDKKLCSVLARAYGGIGALCFLGDIYKCILHVLFFIFVFLTKYAIVDAWSFVGRAFYQINFIIGDEIVRL